MKSFKLTELMKLLIMIIILTIGFFKKPIYSQDSLLNFAKHTLSKRFDTLKKSIDSRDFINQHLRKKDSVDPSFKTSLKNFTKKSNPFQVTVTRKPFFSVGSGSVAYNFLYQSNIDSLYGERNIAQHQTSASLEFNLANIPFRINAYFRKSNSRIFRDIADVQVQFDASVYKSRLKENVQENLLQYSKTLKDSVTEKYYFIKKEELDKLFSWLNSIEISQKLVEANEILNVNEIAFDKTLSDSVNLIKTDSLRTLARIFLKTYDEIKTKKELLSRQVDSLQKLYQNSIARVKQFQQLIRQQQFTTGSAYNQFKRKAEKLGYNNLQRLSVQNWLLGLQKLGIGRNNLYASELTVRNIAINGINLEYNSWYYLQVAAGTIDYRYRDFVVKNLNKKIQNLYLVRVGVGNMDRSFFILSAFHGQKQLFANTGLASHLAAIKISGVSVEAKWQLYNHSNLTAEVAQSFSPNFQVYPTQPKNSWRLSETDNKALSVKWYSYLPKTSSRIEAKYRFSGANFQSFNSFQTNAEVKAWSIKAEQNFINRKIKITGALSKNEFSNPFISQNYKSNTIFKSFSAKMNIRKWPVITVGYLPMSQLSVIDGYLNESKFQTVNASVTHFYKIGQAKSSSSIIFTQFFNNHSDTGFIYFNSKNFFGGQTFFFKNFTINLNISTSRNLDYSYTVLDENVNFPIREGINIGAGIKMNKLNEQNIRLGGLFNGSVTLFREDILSFQIERTYLPAKNLLLVPSTFGNVSFIKTFK
jgi:hypothetical protein